MTSNYLKIIAIAREGMQSYDPELKNDRFNEIIQLCGSCIKLYGATVPFNKQEIDLKKSKR